jgi:hypothetical protein
MLIVFALTLFFSAAMLFLVEPLVGKMMLPLLGGTPAVWNTCMVFFQAVLLAGYGYAHASSHWLGARKQAMLHMGVLLLPIPMLFFIFNGPREVLSDLIAGREGNPIPALLLVLTVLVGLPMFVVCSSAPILQKWFASTDHPAAKDPYFLYGASNLGSMLGLFGYPLVVEPFFSLAGQRIYWTIGFVVLGSLCAACAWLMWRSRPAPSLALAGVPSGLAEGGLGTTTGPASTGVTNAPAEGITTGLPSTGAPAIKGGDKGTVGTPAEKAQLTRDKPRKKKNKDRIKADKPRPLASTPVARAATATAPVIESISEVRRQQPVTLLRRLRWIMLSIVPSSLMLGVTTYMTTDIAAIPLLWVLPLTLYLLTFIIVFAHISPRAQAIAVWIMLACAISAVAIWVAPMVAQEESAFVWLIRVACLPILWFSWRLTAVRSPDLLHKSMVMIMPLLVLLIVFMMLSEIQPGIVGNIVLHLVALFVVSMVCHGELARDRPQPRHLTEFFLLMSTGGVIGGLFNGLFAPMVFSGIVEYPLAMIVACLLVPPLGTFKDSKASRYADIGLAVLFVAVGVLLFYLWHLDHRDQLKNLETKRADLQKDYEEEKDLYTKALKHIPNFNFDKVQRGKEYAAALERYDERIEEKKTAAGDRLKTGPWQWTLVAIGIALFLGAGAWWTNWGAPPNEDGSPAPNHWLDRVLDIALPLALAILVVGLYWGLPSERVSGRLKTVAEYFSLKPAQFRNILTYGLPAVLCYTFVERSLRFGLGVAAIFLAATYCNRIDEPPLYQDRSFFGVLKVQERGNRNSNSYALRLVHGSTLHGKQFINNVHYRHQPLTYYHRTGPVGLTFAAYNRIDRPVGVIGLGTGTMSCYGMVEATMKTEKTVNGKTVEQTRKEIHSCFDLTGDMDDIRKGSVFVDDTRKEIVKVHRKQKVTFYDIDPIVVRLSGPNGQYFKYVDDSIAKGVDINIILGDARLTLAQNQLAEKDKYGLLVVDAFSSDAIPVHLITLEALDMMLTKMQEDGIILFHISNRYLDLQPVLANLVEMRGLACLHMSDDDEDEERNPGKSRSHWVCIARKREYMSKLVANEVAARKKVESYKAAQKALVPTFCMPDHGGGMSTYGMMLYGVLDQEVIPVQEWKAHEPKKDVGIWTDDYSNLLSVFYPYVRWRDGWKKKLFGS